MSYAIYCVEDDATFTERFSTYKSAYNWTYKKYGSIKGKFKIILSED